MGEGKGEKNSYEQRGRVANPERLLNTENKLRVDGGEAGERGKWVTGTEEGTCWDEHWVSYGSNESRNLLPKPRAHCIHCMLANLTINYIKNK